MINYERKEKKSTSCTKVVYQFSETYVDCIIVILTVLSILIVAFGIVVWRKVGPALDVLELQSPVIATMIFGVLLFALSLLGIISEYKTSPNLKMAFCGGTITVLVLTAIAGIFLINYTSFLANVGANNLQFEIEEKLLTYELALFSECCAEDNPLPRSCAEANNIFPCYQDEETFNTFLELINERTCQTWGEFEVGGVPLVGEDPASCAGQDVEEFVELLSGFIEENLALIGTINVVVSIVMMMLTCCTSFVLYSKKHHTDLSDYGLFGCTCSCCCKNDNDAQSSTYETAVSAAGGDDAAGSTGSGNV